jgi:hypothetical protein
MREIKFAHTPAGTQPVKGIYVMLLAAVLLAACGGEEFRDLQDFVRDSAQICVARLILLLKSNLTNLRL